MFDLQTKQVLVYSEIKHYVKFTTQTKHTINNSDNINSVIVVWHYRMHDRFKKKTTTTCNLFFFICLTFYLLAMAKPIRWILEKFCWQNLVRFCTHNSQELHGLLFSPSVRWSRSLIKLKFLWSSKGRFSIPGAVRGETTSSDFSFEKTFNEIWT